MKTEITAEQITSALNEARASAVMITEGIYTESGPEYIAAITAIANEQQHPTPANAAKAEDTAMAFLLARPEVAMDAINKRIARRANRAPLSDAAQRILRGED
jgi:hypothetical protein